MRFVAAIGITSVLLTPALLAQSGAGRAVAAENFYLDVAHPVLVPLESSQITVRLKLDAPLQTGAAQVVSGGAAGASDDFKLRYRIDNWRILEKGAMGQLVPVTGTRDVATFTAPAAKPSQGFVTLSVDLIPLFAGTAKVTLITRIAITDDETTFMLDVPALKISGERYSATGEASPIERALANLPFEQRAAIQGRMIAAGSASGTNLDLVISKSRALYSDTDDATTILIQLPPIASGAGRGSAAPVMPAMDAAVSIVFKGRSTGTFSIDMDKKDNKNAATITRPGGEGFVGGHGRYVTDSGTKRLEMDCRSCSITIDKYDAQWVSGRVSTDVSLFRQDEVIIGRLVGRFKVPVAK